MSESMKTTVIKIWPFFHAEMNQNSLCLLFYNNQIIALLQTILINIIFGEGDFENFMNHRI